MAVIIVALASGALAATEVRSIPTRPGVTLDFLFMAPVQGPRRDILILFPGGNGAVPYRITNEGTAYGWNVLVRSADEFVRRGLAVVTVNPPSDHPNGMSTGFRESPEHAGDIAMLTAYLVGQGFERVFLVGNSRGTLSVAALASQLRDSHIKGIVLTSTLEYDNFMRWLMLDKIGVPVLMVHHREDACRVSAFSEAEKTRDSLRSRTKVDFVEVNGGGAAMSPPCNDLGSHGFFGVEVKVVQVIADWVGGRKIPELIE
jgi:pimeloyl-ACP methyl ester carboxylesterase